MRSVFVTGTDTGVGKTIVAGLLARHLQEHGYRAITQKWVQTGIHDYPSDILTHLKLVGADPEAIQGHEDDVCPYAFDLAASPHLAAAHENVKIDSRRIRAGFRRLSDEFDPVIVEGAGGILVPLNRDELLVDVVQDLGLPVVIVAANKLGAINHTLLTVEALQARNMEVLGIIFNTIDQGQDEIVLQDNPKIVSAFAGVPILGRLPWSESIERLHDSFKPIAKNISAQLAGT